MSFTLTERGIERALVYSHFSGDNYWKFRDCVGLPDYQPGPVVDENVDPSQIMASDMLYSNKVIALDIWMRYSTNDKGDLFRIANETTVIMLVQMKFEDRFLKDILERFVARYAWRRKVGDIFRMMAFVVQRAGEVGKEIAKIIANLDRFSSQDVYEGVSSFDVDCFEEVREYFAPKRQKLVVTFIEKHLSNTPQQANLLDKLILMKDTEGTNLTSYSSELSSLSREQFMEILLHPRVGFKKKIAIIDWRANRDIETTSTYYKGVPLEERAKDMLEVAFASRSWDLLSSALDAAKELYHELGPQQSKALYGVVYNKENLLRLLSTLNRLVGRKKVEEWSNMISNSIKKYMWTTKDQWWSMNQANQWEDPEVFIGFEEYMDHRKVIDVVEDSIVARFINAEDRQKILLVK